MTWIPSPPGPIIHTLQYHHSLFLCVYLLRERERVHKQGQRQTKKQTPHRAGSPKDSLGCDLSRRQELNRLSHPSVPYEHFSHVSLHKRNWGGVGAHCAQCWCFSLLLSKPQTRAVGHSSHQPHMPYWVTDMCWVQTERCRECNTRPRFQTHCKKRL